MMWACWREFYNIRPADHSRLTSRYQTPAVIASILSYFGFQSDFAAAVGAICHGPICAT